MKAQASNLKKQIHPNGKMPASEPEMAQIQKIISPKYNHGPGIVYLKSEKIVSEGKPFYLAVSSKISQIEYFDDISNAVLNLLAPTPIAFVNPKDTKNNPECLIVGLCLTAKTFKPIYVDKLEITYQTVLSDDGFPQINIYVFYTDESQTRTKKTKDIEVEDEIAINSELPSDHGTTAIYQNNYFYLVFPPNSIENISFDLLKYVQVFQTEGDPRTSRGTITTVTQPTTGR